MAFVFNLFLYFGIAFDRRHLFTRKHILATMLRYVNVCAQSKIQNETEIAARICVCFWFCCFSVLATLFTLRYSWRSFVFYLLPYIICSVRKTSTIQLWVYEIQTDMCACGSKKKDEQRKKLKQIESITFFSRWNMNIYTLHSIVSARALVYIFVPTCTTAKSINQYIARAKGNVTEYTHTSSFNRSQHIDKNTEIFSISINQSVSVHLLQIQSIRVFMWIVKCVRCIFLRSLCHSFMHGNCR